MSKEQNKKQNKKKTTNKKQNKQTKNKKKDNIRDATFPYFYGNSVFFLIWQKSSVFFVDRSKKQKIENRLKKKKKKKTKNINDWKLTLSIISLVSGVYDM